ncbi:hypothetical protein Tco_1433605 [Tanacetum coccineum]
MTVTLAHITDDLFVKLGLNDKVDNTFSTGHTTASSPIPPATVVALPVGPSAFYAYVGPGPTYYTPSAQPITSYVHGPVQYVSPHAYPIVQPTQTGHQPSSLLIRLCTRPNRPHPGQLRLLSGQCDPWLPRVRRPLYLMPLLPGRFMIPLRAAETWTQFVRDNNCTIEFDTFGFSVKDFMTRRVLLRSDSTRDLYPVTAPSSIPHAFLEKPPVLCHACQLGKHVRLPFVSSNIVVTACFDIIHSDVWTSPIPSLSDFKYYVLFSDHYS